ncbi:unnamed protein product [Brassicogethes aeneus]|uniref:Uncharacterized protein n=1 Tax=Brassicogethes aeneus TaxID=1431903 RepID=A0A9P0F867_BRAAE|nr:unnamed protein product [Brassicogethes aeneus]
MWHFNIVLYQKLTMKIIILLACLAVAVSANTQEQWKSFKQTHQKSYRSLIEERLRYQIFSDNLEKIHQHNAEFEQGLKTYSQRVNQFADWTEDEFIAFLKLNGPAQKVKSDEVFEAIEAAPPTKDWISLGAVTRIKDQGSCASSWSFSAVGALESQIIIQTGNSFLLSEQQLIDCSGSYGNKGCDGGSMTSAFEYVKDHGIMAEATYPYEEVQGECRFTNESRVILKSSGYVDIKKDSEYELIQALGTVGPISVAVHASPSLQFYGYGIFNEVQCPHHDLNLGLLAIGYEKDHIVLKNSWGIYWGEGGYVKFQRNKNLCGIASMASYPKL